MDGESRVTSCMEVGVGGVEVEVAMDLDVNGYLGVITGIAYEEVDEEGKV